MANTSAERYGHGVYAIVNIKTSELYVGKTRLSFAERWREHRRFLRKGEHHCYLLQQAWNNAGESAFEFRILESLPMKANEIDHLIAEQQHMDRYRTRLYNNR